MIRKFKFENEIYESLNCLPMAARRKLDELGGKLSLAQWEQLGRGERLMICHGPSASEEERDALRTFIEDVAPDVRERSDDHRPDEERAVPEHDDRGHAHHQARRQGQCLGELDRERRREDPERAEHGEGGHVGRLPAQ